MKEIKSYGQLVLFGGIIGGLLLLQGCSLRPSRFDPLAYFPLANGNQWLFDGELQMMTVKDAGLKSKILQAVVVFSDTLHVPLWTETYRLSGTQLQWCSFEPATKLLPQVTFEPPLLAAPFSAKVGETVSISSVEIRSDSTGASSRVPLTVVYRITAVEAVETLLGTFADCLRMEATFTYPSSAERPMFVGDHTWWFAKNIGPVKYKLPSAAGELIAFDLK